MRSQHQDTGSDSWFSHFWQKRSQVLFQFVLALSSSLLAQLLISLFQHWLR